MLASCIAVKAPWHEQGVDAEAVSVSQALPCPASRQTQRREPGGQAHIFERACAGVCWLRAMAASTE